jgi:hypothetical protein
MLLGSINAFASIQVFPTRVELSDENRVANISVRHRGNAPGHYRIDAVFYRMSEDGTMNVVTDATPAERSLVKYLRFNPRQTTLPPNLEQVVRIIVAPPKDLPEGDYRAHLHFMPTDDAEADTSTAAPNGKKNKIQIALDAKLALAIPVVFRHGAPKVNAQLSKLKVVTNADKQLAFSAELSSEGNAFAFGDFVPVFTPKGGAPVELGAARGVASYVPKRMVSFPFSMPAGLTSLSGGKLRLEFREHRADNEAHVLTSAETDVP